MTTMAGNYKESYGAWALVLGASEGLGAAIATELASRGINLALVARREPILAETAKQLSARFGIEARAIVADMADPNVLDVLEKGLAGAEVGFLVYNCAAEHRGEFMVQEVDAHLDNIRVNVTTPTMLVHHFGRAMMKRGKGGLVICSSGAANQGIYSWVSYGAAKAYEMILGEGLWYELRDHGVGATAFMIGSTYTPNFQRTQQEKNTPFAHTRTPDGLPPGVPIPQEPSDAAANLFKQIDKEWIPLTYANPRDEANAQQAKSLTRIEMITRIGDAMRSGYRSMAAS
jgi:short-subunit dehydrogenase